jgi:hypothetical protein
MARHPDYVDIVACARREWEILQLLLRESDNWPWLPITEVMDTTDEPITARDAIAALCDVGLIQRGGEDVMITRAALRLDQLIADRQR